MAFKLKGQGATEYLVLLAVVLIIALVSIALLGFFPGLATDAQITQSAAYWRSEVRPYAIIDSSAQSSNGNVNNVTLVLQNVDASGTFTLTNLSISTPTGSGSFNTSTSFAPGEIKNIELNLTTASPPVAGEVYELTVNITYISPNSVTNTEFGTKTLIGRYS